LADGVGAQVRGYGEGGMQESGRGIKLSEGLGEITWMWGQQHSGNAWEKT